MNNSPVSSNKKKRRCIPSSSRYLLNEYLKTKYELTQNRNFDNFLYKIGVAKKMRQRALNLKPTIKLTQNGKTYTLTTTYGDNEVSKITFEPEKPMVRELKNGSTITSLFIIQHNKLVETLCMNEMTIVVTRTFTPEYLIVTMAINNDKCERYYKKVIKPGEDDIKSETSRRVQSISTMSSTVSTMDEKEIKNIVNDTDSTDSP